MVRNMKVECPNCNRAYKIATRRSRERLHVAIGRYFSAWFWFPTHTKHWKMWRLSIAQLAATRVRFLELGLSLECQGGEQRKQIARDIRKILESKY